MAKDKAKKKEAEAEASSEGGEGGDGEGAPAKKKPPMILLIGAAAAVLVLGGGGAGAFFLLKPKPDAAAEHGEKKEKKKEKKKEEKGGKGGKEGEAQAGVVREGPDGVTFYTLPDLVVNIQSTDGKPTFLKLKLTLELPSAELAEQLDADAPRVADMFQTFLRELRPEDLSGSAGSYQLRQEILRRLNLIVAPEKVNAVLIEEMLIQ
jgi:flagellar FliL protein